MPISKRNDPSDSGVPKDASPPDGKDLLDLPLSGSHEITPRTSPAKRGLGDVDAIGAINSRGKTGGRRASWLWLFLLLAFPLGGLLGYLLSADPPLAALSTDLLDFGEVRLGATGTPQVIRVSNQGEKRLRLDAAILAGDAAGDFRVTADDCAGLEVAARGACSIEIAFAPAESGARRAQIQIESNSQTGRNTVPLIGVGVTPEVTVEPAEIDFGEQAVGDAGAPETLRVINRGTAPLQLGRLELSGPEAGDFRRAGDGCSSRRLAPGERCTARFAFAPGETGERRAVVRIESDAGDPQTATLEGHGVSRQPLLRLDPAGLDYGLVRVGRASPAQSVRIDNDGDGPLIVRALRMEDDTGDVFELGTEDCTSGEVAAGGACNLEVRFSPSAEGAARASLAIESNASPEPARLRLTGTGIAPRARIEPARMSFGEVAVRAASEPQTIRVHSTGSAELKLGAVTVGGADTASFLARGCADAALVPGRECSVEVVFQPQRAGPHRADLIVEHGTGRRQTVVPLNGLGVTARLSLDRSRLELGDVRTGSEARQQLTLTNAGRAALKILRVRLSGNASAFELAAGRCSGVTLAPGATCDVSVTFRPTSAGSHRLSLVIDHTASDRPRDVPVSAFGTAPPVPQIRVEPQRLVFSDLRVSERSTVKTLTVSNPGTARLHLGADVRLTGEHSADFQLVPGSCDGASFVAPGASCTAGVRFVPAGPGTRRARLLIPHGAAGSPVELLLEGTGTER